MANKQIYELPANSSPTGTDVVPTQPGTGGTTSKTTIGTFWDRSNHTGQQSMSTISDAGNSATLDVGTDSGTVAAGDHNHSGVYEPADATILKDADIGSTVASQSDSRFPTSDEKAALDGTGTPSSSNKFATRDDVIYQVVDYTALRALTGQTAGKQASVAYRTTAGDGGGGMFRWDSSDLSASVAADTQSGVYVAPTSDLTGASGCWVRLCGSYLIPEMFGTNTTPGSTDMAAAIRGCNDIASSLSLPILFKGVSYAIASELIYKTPWIGTTGAKIVILDSFAHSQVYSSAPQSFSYIWNENATSTAYNESTADIVIIENIHFEDQKTGTTYAEIIGLANVKGGHIKDCTLSPSGKTDRITNLDLNASVKNFTVEGNKFFNETGASSGGNIWVRNNTSDSADEDSATENIIIRGNYFKHNSGDECVAVWGGIGITQNVVVESNTFVVSGTVQGSLFATFAHNSVSARPDAILRHVRFVGNKINTSGTINNALKVGDENSPSNPCDNVYIANNEVKMSVVSTGSSYLVRQFPGATNVKVHKNHLEQTGETAMAYAVGSVDFVSENYITGNFTTTGIITSPRVTDNTLVLSSIQAAIRNCLVVKRNKITGGLCINADNTATYIIEGNECLPISSHTSNVIYVRNAANATIRNNVLTLSNASQRSMLFQNTGYKVVEGNDVRGTGLFFPSGAMIKASGNYWGSYFDDFHNSSSIDATLLAALPTGHFIRNNDSSLAVDGNGYLLSGWVKVTGGTLQAIYVPDSSPP